MIQEIPKSKLPEIRQALLEQQGFCCAICGKKLDPSDATDCHVDHQHRFKSEHVGVNGAGMIRGILCRDCNALEGKIWNAIHRFGKTSKDDPVGSRVEFLQKLQDYYNKGCTEFVHPNERTIEKLGKAEYNRLIKKFKLDPKNYNKNGTLKPTPKYTGRWSKKLRELAENG